MCCCCCCNRSVRLLLWRNCIRRKRAKLSSLVELVSPILVVVLFRMLYTLFPNTNQPAQQYINNQNTVQPLAGYAYRLSLYNAYLGIGACVYGSVWAHPWGLHRSCGEVCLSFLFLVDWECAGCQRAHPLLR